ncbi:hypothetical protein FOA22_13525 [Heyndrickxia oleronia]|uniref:hypothetical protein n=1 Tax=Heyndrickxia oleronia TaxID=38875 RepID=UPI003335D864
MKLDGNIKELIINEFQNDPIYKLAVINGLEEYFFSDSILSIHPETTYSTVECGKIIGRADSTIRNHFRTGLIDYIEPEKFGKYYRLNYKSIFKLHLIFLLMEKAGKGTIDILVELGAEPAVSLSQGTRIPRSQSQHNDSPSVYGQNLEDITLRMSQYEQVLQKLIFQNQIRDQKTEKLLKVKEIEMEIERLERQIEKVELEAEINHLEEKQSNLLISSLNKSLQKPSLLNVIKNSFSKEQAEITLDPLTQSMSENLRNKKLHYIEEKTKIPKEKLNELRENQKQLLKEIQNLNQKEHLERETMSFLQEQTEINN